MSILGEPGPLLGGELDVGGDPAPLLHRVEPVVSANRTGSWPYTPPTNLLYGLETALAMLSEEGLPEVFDRHRRHGRQRHTVRARNACKVAEDEDLGPVMPRRLEEAEDVLLRDESSDEADDESCRHSP